MANRNLEWDFNCSNKRLLSDESESRSLTSKACQMKSNLLRKSSSAFMSEPCIFRLRRWLWVRATPRSLSILYLSKVIQSNCLPLGCLCLLWYDSCMVWKCIAKRVFLPCSSNLLPKTRSKSGNGNESLRDSNAFGFNTVFNPFRNRFFITLSRLANQIEHRISKRPRIWCWFGKIGDLQMVILLNPHDFLFMLVWVYNTTLIAWAWCPWSIWPPWWSRWTTSASPTPLTARRRGWWTRWWFWRGSYIILLWSIGWPFIGSIPFWLSTAPLIGCKTVDNGC